jgi:HlyD family secretion protein
MPIKARVSGVVEAVYCSADAQVKAHQLCAKIDARPYRALLERAEADLTAAKTRLQKDDVDLARVRARFERHEWRATPRSKETEASRINYEQLGSRRKGDEEAAARLQTTLDAARANLVETDIVSPIGGIVVARDVEPSRTVEAGAERPLFIIATDLASVQVNAHVSEKDLGAVESGDKVSFTITNLPKRSFAGEVTHVDHAPRANQNTADHNVVVSAPNPDLSLRPGMSATLRIVITKNDDASRRAKP